MLMLVTADNLVQLFFGWEGVGLASYLLIGYLVRPPQRQPRRDEGVPIVNRVGDYVLRSSASRWCSCCSGPLKFDTEIFARVPRTRRRHLPCAGFGLARL